MKRALAERAKQSGLPNGVGPSVPTSEADHSSSNNSHNFSSPPLSVPSQPDLSSTASQQDGTPGSPANNSSFSKTSISIAKSNGGSSSPFVTSPRPKKRLRESIVKLDDEDEEDSNASAFYLRHQNRALASELRQMKYHLTRLERERDVRRSQCKMAAQSVHALQVTWNQLESALQHGASKDCSNVTNASGKTDSKSSSSAPLSTGCGTSVELIGSLLNSLNELGNTCPKRRRIKLGESMDVDTYDDSESSSDDDGGLKKSDAPASELMPPPEGMEEDDPQHSSHPAHLDDLLQISDNVAKRASTLQDWIWSMIQRCEQSNGDIDDSGSSTPAQVNAAQHQITRLKAKNKTLKAQMQELARSRDELRESDKRVRRGLYRLAAGRVELKEVLKAIVAVDEDKEAAEVEATTEAPAAPTPTTKPEHEDDGDDQKEESAVDSAEVAQLQKRVSDLEQIATARDEQIKTLLAEKEEQSKKISDLVFANNGKSTAAPTDDDIKNSDMYAELNTKLLAAERTVKELEGKQSKMKEEWGQALATASEAQKAVEDLNQKHVKRWTDLMEEFPELSAADTTEGNEGKTEEKPGDNNENSAEEKTKENTGEDAKAKEITTLQHKLTQALENVRQAQTTRTTLQEAVTMNESLQSKLEEIKSKYNTLQQNRSNTTGNSNGAPAEGGVPTPKSKSPASTEKAEKIDRHEKSDKSSDKLHREYRRVQKQLAAATASKESAKAKLEKAEKERDMLNSTNARLLKQAAEKDEMNAKSLSTILHLKQLTEQITKEKENLEQQVKSSQQLALSARLAANARERLSEEIEKERESMESRVKEWEEECNSLAREKEQIETRMMQNRSRMAGLMKEVEGAKGRCEELASESTKLQQEKQAVLESLAVAKKDAEEAAKMTERLSKASGGAIVEGFTADQLHTQVKHLQSRVHCPVCNVRDKKCILLRCRHMFCKNCVDENIKNRSRKCPACGIRFDTKDVADIWL